MELDKVAQLLVESVDLDDMIMIINEEVFLEFDGLSEDIELLDEEVKSSIFNKLTSKLDIAKLHLKSGNVNKGTLTALVGALTVASLTLISMEVKRVKAIVDSGYTKEDEAEDLAESDVVDMREYKDGKRKPFYTYGDLSKELMEYDARTREYDARMKRHSEISRKAEEELRIIEAKLNSFDSKRSARDKPMNKKAIGMTAIVIASISIIVAYTNVCKKKGIPVTAPVKSAFNRIKNIFKSAKSKNPDSAGQYDDMIDRVDSALDKIED